MNKFFFNMFSSSEGVSHKRVISVFAVVCVATYTFMNESERGLEALEYIAIAYGLGTVVEKFAKNGNKEGQQVD